MRCCKKQPEGWLDKTSAEHAALTGWQGVPGCVKGQITLKGFCTKPGMWPNSTRCFAHTKTGREQKGPLGWSDQLHNADTFSLTSVKLEKKRGGRSCALAWVLKKKISLKNTWHHHFTYDATLCGISFGINTLSCCFLEVVPFLTQLPAPVWGLHSGLLMLSNSAGNR